MPIIQEIHVNGAKRAIQADGERSLLSVLRDDLELTGCKYGCGEGRCGACTVLVDGRPFGEGEAGGVERGRDLDRVGQFGGLFGRAGQRGDGA